MTFTGLEKSENMKRMAKALHAQSLLEKLTTNVSVDDAPLSFQIGKEIISELKRGRKVLCKLNGESVEISLDGGRVKVRKLTGPDSE